MLASSGLLWVKRTSLPNSSDSKCDVILLDTIGELSGAYALADLVFVGGSIVNKGGQNVLEPASAGVTVVTGAYTDNFEAIVRLLKEHRALIQLPPLEERDAANQLTEIFDDLLRKPELRKEMGERASQLVANNQGAADRTMELISLLLLDRPGASGRLDPVLAPNPHTS